MRTLRKRENARGRGRGRETKGKGQRDRETETARQRNGESHREERVRKVALDDNRNLQTMAFEPFHVGNAAIAYSDCSKNFENVEFQWKEDKDVFFFLPKTSSRGTLRHHDVGHHDCPT